MSFRAFLSSIAGIKAADHHLFVLGNSSADYDSIFGSLIYAYYLTQMHSTLHLPLIDCKQADIPLRFEVSHVMEALLIDYKQLHYTESIDLGKEGDIFYLYDHNQRDGISQVGGIVDHHVVGRGIRCRKEDALICHMGSALTLLYFILHPSQVGMQGVPRSEFESAFRDYGSSKEIYFEDRDVEEIIHYGILLDTFGFEQSDRWTPFDRLASDNIAARYTFPLQFEQLNELKFSLEANLKLSLQQHLRKDYKKIDYGLFAVEYSIVQMGPVLFYQHYNLPSPEANTILLMFLSLQPDGSISRSMTYRCGELSPSVQLSPFLLSIGMHRREPIKGWSHWQDPSGAMSRKKLDRLLREYLSHSHDL